MFELLFFALLVFIGGTFILKVLFFIMGMAFAGLGFLIKMIIAVLCCVLFFPLILLVVGTVLSGGFLVFILGAVALAALISEGKQDTY